MSINAQHHAPVARVTQFATVDGLSLAYDTFGSGEPLLLIMGIAAQRVYWDDRFCEQLAAGGYQVIRFDHRDVGESTHLPKSNVDVPLRALTKRFTGRAIDAPYTLDDMAKDCVGLLTHLGHSSAHIVGISMGGMIAQHLALDFPSTIRSLTLIMTTPGSRRYLPEVRAMKALMGRRADNEDQAVAVRLATFEIIGSPQFPMDRQRLSDIVRIAYRRDSSIQGFIHHFAATLASGDRSKRLGAIKAPTLVIHGTMDPLIPVSAGARLVELIPSAKWLPVAGMGHDFGEMVWPFLIPSILRHADAS
jgi:pimeloyl-ACP methyl ester carboxylesterase